MPASGTGAEAPESAACQISVMSGHLQVVIGWRSLSKMSSFTFDESGSVAQLPKELGENVTSMLGGKQMSTEFSPC